MGRYCLATLILAGGRSRISVRVFTPLCRRSVQAKTDLEFLFPPIMSQFWSGIGEPSLNLVLVFQSTFILFVSRLTSFIPEGEWTALGTPYDPVPTLAFAGKSSASVLH
jgi:hypothetical protein